MLLKYGTVDYTTLMLLRKVTMHSSPYWYHKK